VPFLGDLPVLGAFFKRQQNQQERQELIIVATPRLVGPMYPGKIPPLPGAATAALNPSIGQMLLGTDGLEQASRPFGVVRR
jgi:pilus assembly protein CpaC